ncbi:MAG: hypothetical protein M1829_000049 [Trizodia sp. TS-e1964]|nr:MAG: hypothetical protein M1829_000049 [Trizodia sp. TS-e1964]
MLSSTTTRLLGLCTTLLFLFLLLAPSTFASPTLQTRALTPQGAIFYNFVSAARRSILEHPTYASQDTVTFADFWLVVRLRAPRFTGFALVSVDANLPTVYLDTFLDTEAAIYDDRGKANWWPPDVATLVAIGGQVEVLGWMTGRRLFERVLGDALDERGELQAESEKLVQAALSPFLNPV